MHLMAYATTGDLARVFLASGVPTRAQPPGQRGGEDFGW